MKTQTLTIVVDIQDYPIEKSDEAEIAQSLLELELIAQSITIGPVVEV